MFVAFSRIDFVLPNSKFKQVGNIKIIFKVVLLLQNYEILTFDCYKILKL